MNDGLLGSLAFIAAFLAVCASLLFWSHRRSQHLNQAFQSWAQANGGVYSERLDSDGSAALKNLYGPGIFVYGLVNAKFSRGEFKAYVLAFAHQSNRHNAPYVDEDGVLVLRSGAKGLSGPLHILVHRKNALDVLSKATAVGTPEFRELFSVEDPSGSALSVLTDAAQKEIIAASHMPWTYLLMDGVNLLVAMRQAAKNKPEVVSGCLDTSARIARALGVSRCPQTGGQYPTKPGAQTIPMICIGWILILLAALGTFTLLRNLVREYSLLGLPQAPGTMVSCEPLLTHTSPMPSKDRSSAPLWTVVARLTYTVNGKSFEGKNLSNLAPRKIVRRAFPGDPPPESIAALCRNYQAGTPVLVRYDPGNPQRSFVFFTSPLRDWPWAIWPALAAFVGWFLVFGVRYVSR
jgi:hypothetical protein